MDFDALRNSQFYKLGQLSYNFSTDTVFSAPFASYDIGSKSELMSVMPKKNYSSSRGSIKPHLYRLMGTEMPTEFLDLISSQWLDMLERIKHIDEQSLLSTFVIQSPGSTIPRHGHLPTTKQILTYCFRFKEQAIESADKSHMNVGPDEQQRRVDFIDEDKIVFTILDNQKHDATTNEWRFFWVFDFQKKFELTGPLVDGFTVMKY